LQAEEEVVVEVATGAEATVVAMEAPTAVEVAEEVAAAETPTGGATTAAKGTAFWLRRILSAVQFEIWLVKVKMICFFGLRRLATLSLRIIC